MYSSSRWHLPLLLLVAAPAIAQRAAAPPPLESSPAFQAQALAPDATADTRAIMDLMMKIEAATVSGDTAYVEAHTSPDFTMVHGDHWANGGLAQLADDKAAYLNRVSGHFYLIHDIDPRSIHFEMHKDVAIAYGRYMSVTNPRPGSRARSSYTSIWFERVFQKRNGEWIYLSHRTVHGPIPSPAAIDPTAIAWDTGRKEELEISPLLPNDPMARSNSGVPLDKNPTVSKSPEVQEILAFEHKQEAAVVNGDVDFLEKAVPDDFIMVHGDNWIRGGKPLGVDDKAHFIARAKSRYYKSRDLDNEKVELHGNVAITYGRYIAYTGPGKDPSRDWFSIWFERVYEKQPDGSWQFLSHRTVHGPTYGATRESVSAVPEPYSATPPWY